MRSTNLKLALTLFGVLYAVAMVGILVAHRIEWTEREQFYRDPVTQTWKRF